MGAYSFKQQFVPLVESGEKTHTIRAYRKHPDRAGSTCHLFYGMRTKHCRKLFSAPCVKVEIIEILVRYDPSIWIADMELSPEECELFAHRDGFRGDGNLGAFQAMIDFWQENHGSTVFQGHVIHWDYSKRVLPEVSQ